MTHPELQLAAKLASDYVETLDSLNIAGETDPVVVRQDLAKELQEDGLPPEVVISELHRDATPGIMNTGSGRYFAYVVGGTLPVTIATDFLVSAWDQNAGAYVVAPSAAIVEEVVGMWLKDLLRLPKHASFALVTGCQTAHVTALAAARHHLLRKVGWNVEENGLFGAPRIRVIVGEHFHETLLRALRFLGIGTKAIVEVDSCPETGTMDLKSLEQELENEEESDCCTIVAVAAGDLNRGMFDPIKEICEIAHAKGAWVHVDGAFGLWAVASPKYQHLLEGIENADSWATDAHKVLNVPQDCGIAFCRHVDAHKASMDIYAPYAVNANKSRGEDDVDPVRDQYQWGPQWSRRGRGFTVYAALRCLGRSGVANMFEQFCDLSAALVRGLGELEGVEVLTQPVINQGLVRFLDPSGKGHHDGRTKEIVDRITKDGEVWFGTTTWHDMCVMRVSVCSHRTTPEDVQRAIRAVKKVLVQDDAALHNVCNSH